MEKSFAGNRSKSTTLGGTRTVADIMNALEKSLEQQVMDGIHSINEELGAQIRDLMFTFENLVDLDDRSIQMILREISSEILVVALKGSDQFVQEKNFWKYV